jgi:hypothetical protein
MMDHDGVRMDHDGTMPYHDGNLVDRQQVFRSIQQS